ncbi:hypothetical protein K466DRAFT_581193 [Polyporus arcularius HHB13444]|uniref:Uncharacterized protein n=1 Tax=Polyporus arcularius HHB13444 TaxID=1314778 RepID=A0A5C3PU88_9APHY|nr:hypothetical protein K466DRAFT_581193 [Polyporus arcularius HHB13444]
MLSAYPSCTTTVTISALPATTASRSRPQLGDLRRLWAHDLGEISQLAAPRRSPDSGHRRWQCRSDVSDPGGGSTGAG